MVTAHHISGKANRRQAMTLVELLIALMVLGMVLTGVTTLAFALGSVKDSSDDTSRKQACLRYAMVQLADLLKHSRLVCYASDSQVTLWTMDTNGDGRMNVSEIACIWTNAARNAVMLSRFTSIGNSQVPRASITDCAVKWWLVYGATESSVTAIPECSNVRFVVDSAAPATQTVSISFRMTQSGDSASYSISGYLRARTGNVLDAGNDIVSDDD